MNLPATARVCSSLDALRRRPRRETGHYVAILDTRHTDRKRGREKEMRERERERDGILLVLPMPININNDKCKDARDGVKYKI